jgi:hypothetical protein
MVPALCGSRGQPVGMRHDRVSVFWRSALGGDATHLGGLVGSMTLMENGSNWSPSSSLPVPSGLFGPGHVPRVSAL